VKGLTQRRQSLSASLVKISGCSAGRQAAATAASIAPAAIVVVGQGSFRRRPAHTARATASE